MSVILLLLLFFILFSSIVISIRKVSLHLFVLIYTLLWLTSSLFTSIVLGYYISELAYLSIFSLAFCFCLPLIIISDPSTHRKQSVEITTSARISFFYVIAVLFAVFGIVMHVKSVGSSSILEVAVKSSALRYSGDENYGSKWQVLGSAFLFVCLYFFGFVKGEIKRNKITFSLISCLVLLTAILTSSKASFLFSVSFFLSGMVNSYIINCDRIFNKEKLGIILSGVVVVLLILVFSNVVQLFRYGFEVDTIWSVVDKISIYVFGQFSAYSIWFDNIRDFDNSLSIPGYGIFTGIYSIFFSLERADGFYSDMVYITDTQWTNVFTLSRFIIHEFGIFGGLILMFLLGLICSILLRLFSGNYIARSIIMLPILVECIFSFSTSILSYNSVVFSVLIISLCKVVFLTGKKERSIENMVNNDR